MASKETPFTGPLGGKGWDRSFGYNSREEYEQAIKAMAENGTMNRALRRANAAIEKKKVKQRRRKGL
jgi:hypothetical protein